MDDSPGITRKRTAKGFVYMNVQGRVLRQTKFAPATSRPQVEMREGVNSIDITPAGVKYVTRQNSTA
jgi:hypothetical protein